MAFFDALINEIVPGYTAQSNREDAAEVMKQLQTGELDSSSALSRLAQIYPEQLAPTVIKQSALAKMFASSQPVPQTGSAGDGQPDQPVPQTLPNADGARQTPFPSVNQLIQSGWLDPKDALSLQETQRQRLTQERQQAETERHNRMSERIQGGGLVDGDGNQPNQALTGEAYLATLPTGIASEVKAIVRGDMAPPSAGNRSNKAQQLLTALYQYDPNADTMSYGTRAATRKDFTSGKTADNITALNTAMSHLSSLSDSYDQLDNGSVPALNSAENYLGRHFGNEKIQANVANVSTKAEAVAHELAKVFRSTGMSEAEIDAWKQKISTNASPAESKAVIGSAVDLMNGRLQALASRYNEGMKTSKQGVEFLSPEAQKAYQNINAKIGRSVEVPEVGDQASSDLSAMSTEQLQALRQKLAGKK